VVAELTYFMTLWRHVPNEFGCYAGEVQVYSFWLEDGVKGDHESHCPFVACISLPVSLYLVDLPQKGRSKCSDIVWLQNT
jgi:hypothetical protein